MVTLQLKDICSYLPYELKVQRRFCDGESIYLETWTADEIMKIWGIDKLLCDKIKPILRPMSDLTKPITHNGKEIIPIVELAKITMQDAIRKEYWKPEDFVLVGDKVKLGNYTFFYEKRECFSWSYKYSDLNDQTALYQLQIFDLIHELKIDIRGLIPQGLAVSVDEFEVNPYK